jgi:hypothetical protein
MCFLEGVGWGWGMWGGGGCTESPETSLVSSIARPKLYEIRSNNKNVLQAFGGYNI